MTTKTNFAFFKRKKLEYLENCNFGNFEIRAAPTSRKQFERSTIKYITGYD